MFKGYRIIPHGFGLVLSLNFQLIPYICPMARLMAIDYGTKRIGIADTDPGQIIATALDTVHSKDVIEFLRNYFSREEVECIVVGDPRQMDNTGSEISRLVDNFVKELKRKFPAIPIDRYDERFTSVIARDSILMSGLKKSDRRKKELIDQTSAVILLQSYMEYRKNKL